MAAVEIQNVSFRMEEEEKEEEEKAEEEEVKSSGISDLEKGKIEDSSSGAMKKSPDEQTKNSSKLELGRGGGMLSRNNAEEEYFYS